MEQKALTPAAMAEKAAAERKKLNLTEAELAGMKPQDFRLLVRAGEWTGHTMGACRGFVQTNMAIIPRDYAFEFLLFCYRNPKVCSVIDITTPGDPHPKGVSPEADLRTDLPGYRVFRKGKLIAEPNDIRDYWQDDLVAFLFSATVVNDWLLEQSNVQFRYIGSYTTNIQCVPAGRFKGPMVASCRLFKSNSDAIRAIQVTSRNPAAHGGPVHIGNPAAIGIKDLYYTWSGVRPDFPPPEPDEMPMFWGNGVTTQTKEAVKEANLPLMITHLARHMFITDKRVEELTVL